jgi:hypothetical protein
MLPLVTGLALLTYLAQATSPFVTDYSLFLFLFYMAGITGFIIILFYKIMKSIKKYQFSVIFLNLSNMTPL